METAFEEITSKLESWGKGLVALAPNVVVALLILIIAWLISRAMRKATTNLLGRLNVGAAVTGLVATVIAILVVAIGFFVALGVLQLEKTVTSLLAGAGVLGLVIGFALQDSAADVLAGVMLAVRKPFMVGELIDAQDAFGKVFEINLRATLLDTPDGKRVILPNREVFTNRVTNHSRIGRRRVDVAVGVSYGEDLEHVEKVVRTAVEAVSVRLENTDVDVLFEAFGDSSINLVARFWIRFSNRQVDYRQALSEAMKRIKAAFDREDIMIPFPIRTLDFGIKGGKRLDSMLGAGDRTAA